MSESRIVPASENECCGCGGCESGCPEAAISMRINEEGFLYPQVNPDMCIGCGICVKICGFYNGTHKAFKDENINCFAVAHNEEKIRLNSRSGGVFVACAEWILAQGGIVYGCVLDEGLRAVHIRAKERNTCDLMCKSKYVQSDTTGVFKSVEEDLSAGYKVLFTGTGCQIGCLLSFLEQRHIKTDNLYTVDFICHGVPSPLLFEDFKTWLENKYKDKLEDFNFRDKAVCGWDGHVESAKFRKRTYKGFIYRELFYTNLAIRPSCYNCKFITPGEHKADITIGDAWGIKQAAPEFNDNKGVSVCICNSEKGKQMMEYIGSVSAVKELPLQGAMLQPNLLKPSTPKGNRAVFWEIYKAGGIEAVINRYAKKSLAYKIKDRLKYIIRKILYGNKYYLP